MSYPNFIKTEPIKALNGHNNTVHSIVFTQDELLVSCGKDG